MISSPYNSGLRGPLQFPGGTPRLDPAHVASQLYYQETISIVPNGQGSFFPLNSSFITNASSAGAANISSAIGPNVQFSGTQFYAANSATSAIPLFLTMAAIVQPTSISAGAACIVGPTQTSPTFGTFYLNAGVPTIYFNGALSSGIPTFSANVPYFCAVSIIPGGTAYFVARNLFTGVIWTGSVSMAGKGMPTFTPYVAFGNNNAVGTGTQPLPGLGPAMLSCGFVSQAQLVLWAQNDPWGFWYTRAPRNVVILPSAGGGFTPKFRKTLSMYGSGVGKRQSQAA